VVKKRGNSWWVVVYTGRDPLTGKKRQKTGTAKTWAEARQLEARLIREAGTGQHRAAGNKLEAGWSQAAAGTTLLHGDLRADNLLLTPGRVMLVDWPTPLSGRPGSICCSCYRAWPCRDLIPRPSSPGIRSAKEWTQMRSARSWRPSPGSLLPAPRSPHRPGADAAWLPAGSGSSRAGLAATPHQLNGAVASHDGRTAVTTADPEGAGSRTLSDSEKSLAGGRRSRARWFVALAATCAEDAEQPHIEAMA
jgi:hypothetical protein